MYNYFLVQFHTINIIWFISMSIAANFHFPIHLTSFCNALTFSLLTSLVSLCLSRLCNSSIYPSLYFPFLQICQSLVRVPWQHAALPVRLPFSNHRFGWFWLQVHLSLSAVPFIPAPSSHSRWRFPRLSLYCFPLHSSHPFRSLNQQSRTVWSTLSRDSRKTERAYSLSHTCTHTRWYV